MSRIPGFSRASGRPSVSMLAHSTRLSTKNTAFAFLTLIEIWYCTFLCHCRIVALWATVSLFTRTVFCPSLSRQNADCIASSRNKRKRRCAPDDSRADCLGRSTWLAQSKKKSWFNRCTNERVGQLQRSLYGRFFLWRFRTSCFLFFYTIWICLCDLGGWTCQRSNLLGSRHESMAVFLEERQ